MRLSLTLALALGALPGCIIVDAGCSGPQCEDPFGDDLWDDDDGDGLADDDGSADPDIPDLTLEFFPPTAEAGEVFLASITVGEGQADLREISAVHLYGEVDLLVWGARASELTATLSVPATAPASEVDVVVEFADGRAELLPAALTIFPAGSGNSADEWQNGGPAEGDCE